MALKAKQSVLKKTRLCGARKSLSKKTDFEGLNNITESQTFQGLEQMCQEKSDLRGQKERVKESRTEGQNVPKSVKESQTEGWMLSKSTRRWRTKQSVPENE